MDARQEAHVSRDAVGNKSDICGLWFGLCSETLQLKGARLLSTTCLHVRDFDFSVTTNVLTLETFRMLV